ncbi:fibronectin type III domain-containing protein [Desulfosarcina sp.]|uniref:fibronectin type III domain-containing protein n=1 Tax=Desulfosarcina sp. TaxID=2027861 RepID=UPI003970B09F
MNGKPEHHQIGRIGSILCSLFTLLILSASAAMAANVTLRWDPNDHTPEGYRVFARRSDQLYDYSRPDWEGTASSCTISNLEDRTEYYFVVRAYDSSLESADSEEVHYIPPISFDQTQDITAPSWDGATTGIGLTTDTGSGGRVTVEFDTAGDGEEGMDLRFNVYYALSRSWNNADWTSNSVIADAAVTAGSTFAHAVMVSGLTNGALYTFGVRVEDQSGNEDGNTRTLKATPTVRQTSSAYCLMLSAKPDRSTAVYLDDAGVEGNIYVFVEPITDIRRVEFFIDGVLHQTENYAPYDLAGGISNWAKPFNTGNLSNGYHTFSGRITKTNGSRETISADVQVY